MAYKRADGYNFDEKVNRTYFGMKSRSGKVRFYKNVELRVSRDEFIAWCNANKDLKRLAKAYLASGSKRAMTPSIDRIDSKGHYEIGNMQWVTLAQNTRNALQGKKMATDTRLPARVFQGICEIQFCKQKQARSYTKTMRGIYYGKYCSTHNMPRYRDRVLADTLPGKRKKMVLIRELLTTTP